MGFKLTSLSCFLNTIAFQSTKLSMFFFFLFSSKKLLFVRTIEKPFRFSQRRSSREGVFFGGTSVYAILQFPGSSSWNARRKQNPDELQEQRVCDDFFPGSRSVRRSRDFRIMFFYFSLIRGTRMDVLERTPILPFFQDVRLVHPGKNLRV